MTESATAIVETRAGKVEGAKRDGFYVFKGIPYAAPPVGERRWLPPQPVEPWSGVRPAQTYGTIAPQNMDQIAVLQEFRADEPQNEDCLYLNIWTPSLDSGLRPVLCWIHGGGFTQGSGSQPVYRGDTLVTRGNVVMVSINYRLGALGFLNLNEVTKGKIPAMGNEGLLDQVFALEWVRDNIAAFGGDPDNVTIFGESAGGMSIGCLLALPRARGLFHRAIPQSGAANTALSLEGAVQVAEQFLDILGLSASDVDAIRSLTVERMLPAQLELLPRMFRTNLRITMPFQPVIDGKTLPAMPLDAVRGGSAKKIPVMVGSTLEEWKLLGMMDPGLPKLDEAGLVRRCQRLVPVEHVESLVETYRNARSRRGEPVTPPELFMAIQTDRVFRIPAIRLAEAQHQNNQSAYNYLFTWRSPMFNGALGACHGLELGFIFGIYEKNFSGSGPAADALARNIQDGWLAFARTGNPSCESLGTWPHYGERRETMLLGEEYRVVEALYEEERRIWDSIPATASGWI